MSHFDTIVIGAGHNGLICATTLARHGQKVLCIEANERSGGLAADREFYPGFSAPVAQTLYALPQQVIDDLELDQYGFELHETTLDLIALSQGSPPIRIKSDRVEGVSAKDNQAFTTYSAALETFASALAPFWSKTMPAVSDRDMASLMTFGHLGLKLRLMGKDDMLEFFRVATLPMRDLLDEFFDNDALKAALCWDGLVGSAMAPRSPNQAVLTLLNRMAGICGGRHSQPKGGMPALVAALDKAAAAAGVETRHACPVARINVAGDENGQRVTGITLTSGEVIDSSRVISSADPKTTFFDLVGARHLEIEFSNRIRRLRTRGYVARLNLALADEPAFSGLERGDGRMILASNMDDIEFAWDAAKYGGLPELPVMEVMIPSLHHKSVSPPGQHVLCANVMYIPGELKTGWTEDVKFQLKNRLIAQLEQVAPEIGKLILHSELLTPADLEAEYHVTGGHWHHAEMAVDQLLMMRPTYEAAQYRTPIAGLHLCGAGSHPGGDITGNPGRNAAREVLS